MTEDLLGALRLLTDLDHRDPDYCRVLSSALSIDGASVATLGTLLGTETLSASDEHAMRVDELQFDLGEGPCWDAMRLGLPVLSPGLNVGQSSPWPALISQLPRPVDGLFAFPLVLGPLKIGAVDFYSSSGQKLGEDRTASATTMAAVITRKVLRSALTEMHEEYQDDATSRHSRRTIHQATGMVFAQLSVQIDDAQLVLEGHAFATGRSLMDVADDVVSGRIVFSLDGKTMRDNDER